MEPTSHMYHRSSFYFQKNQGVNDWAGERRIQKIPWNSQNLHFNITYKQIKKRYEGRDFFTVFQNHLTLALTKKLERETWTLNKEMKLE